MHRFCLLFVVAACLIGVDAFAQTPPASPPAKPPSPSDLPISESAKAPQGYTIGLSTCFAKGDIITCKFVMTRNAPGDVDYTYDAKTWFGGSKIVDNFKEEHPINGGYMLDGKNKHVNKLNLESGDSVVVSQDYGGDKPDGVDTIRVIFFQGGGYNWPPIILHGTLEAVQ